MSGKPKLSTEPYKGVRDFYPEDQAFLNYFIATCKSVVEKAGYAEYHASILEPAELYRAKGADNEEIVSGQTYTFTDRGGREVTLRPEMTPTVARMVAGRRREFGFPLRLYSIPNVFRYERPQRGRLREHWQLNVDIFGSHSPYADAEIIGIAYGIMKAFGAKDDEFVIKVNSRATLNALAQKFNLNEKQRSEFLYLLDRRAKMPAGEFESALHDLGVDSAALEAKEAPPEIAAVVASLQETGFKNVIFDPSVVRGFDYYTGMVFEVFDTSSENNRSLFGGGRYDNLTALFDDEALPGVGFGMGDVTMRDFLTVRGRLPEYRPPTQLYIAVTAPELALQAQTLAGELRTQGINTAIDFGDKKLGDQIKNAGKQKIPCLIVVGEDELKSGEFTVKKLESGEETKVRREELAAHIVRS